MEETVLFLADDYNCFPLTIKIIPEWKITVLSINDSDNSFFQIATTRTDTTTNNSDSLKIYYSLDFYPKDRNTQQYNISLGFNKSQDVQCFNLADSYVGTAKLTLNKVVLNENSENPKVIFNSASPTNDPYKTNISAKYIHSKYGNDPNPTANNYGESNNPFIISNVRHFQNIKYSPSAYFNQVNNIDFNYSYTATRQGFAFSGVYNGQNFELNNVSLSYWTTNALISREIYQCWGGLFSVNKGVIENVNITVYSYVDSAVDYGTPGVVSTVNYVGGIVGKNYGTIKNCETHGTIQSYSFNSKSGGVVGYNSEGDILSCKNYTEMTSYGDVGGIVGYDYKGYIYNSENRARVYLDLYNEINRSAGGIVGEGVNSCISEVKNFNIIYWKGTYSTSRTLAPRMGGFAGTLTNGYFHGTNYSYVYEGKLHTEVWKSGSKNYSWCQYQYAEETGLVGRQL